MSETTESVEMNGPDLPFAFGWLFAFIFADTPVMTGAIPTAEEAAIIADVAHSVGIAVPSWLTAVMDHESNLKTTSVNPSSQATGLIQFLGTTACSLMGVPPAGKNKNGTPWWTEAQRIDALKRVKAMSFREQMELVRKYLMNWKGRYQTGLDVALAVFYPVAIGNYGYVIAKQGQKAYEWNKALDKDKKGFIVPTDYARSLMKFALRHGVSMSPVDTYLVMNAAAKTLNDLFQLINRILKENPKHEPHAWVRIQTSITKDMNRLGASHSTVVPLGGSDTLDYRKTLDKQIRAAFGIQTEYTVTKYVMENPAEAAKGVVETTAQTIESGVNAAADVLGNPKKLMGAAAVVAALGLGGRYLLKRLF